MTNRPDKLEWERTAGGYYWQSKTFNWGVTVTDEQKMWLDEAWSLATSVRDVPVSYPRKGSIQADILIIMADGAWRNAKEMSAAIAAKLNRRHAVSSIQAALSGMVAMRKRYWLQRQGKDRDGQHVFRITDRGIEAVSRAHR